MNFMEDVMTQCFDKPRQERMRIFEELRGGSEDKIKSMSTAARSMRYRCGEVSYLLTTAKCHSRL